MKARIFVVVFSLAISLVFGNAVFAKADRIQDASATQLQQLLKTLDA
jgi:hypothetical protein